MQNPIPPELTLGVVIVAFALTGMFMPSATGMIALMCFGVIITSIVYPKVKEANYNNSPVARQFAKLLGFQVHNCGCVYEKSYSVRITNVPESEWMEQEKVYERSMVGAKVRFQKKRSGMKRCTQCGNHYHTTESMGNRNSHRRICWPEEEPDVREELDHRVVES